MGELKPAKNFGFQKFISFILSDVEKFSEFSGINSEKIRRYWFARKLILRHDRLELTLVVSTAFSYLCDGVCEIGSILVCVCVCVCVCEYKQDNAKRLLTREN